MAAKGFPAVPGHQIADHLIDVHVGLGATARLPDLQGKLIIVMASSYRFGGPLDPIGLFSAQQAMAGVHHCQRCRDFTESDLCGICQSERRDKNLLCIVESPADVIAIEATGGFQGTYFVLMGHLSPLDGIGPEDIGLDQLKRVIDSEAPDEVILATNSTVEGEATAHFIAEMLKGTGTQLTRIASGVPLGGELEYIDGGTLMHSFSGRKPYSS